MLVSPRWPWAKLGAFQTKANWTKGSSPALIEFSAHELLAWCEAHPTARVHVNMPGVGHKSLQREEVLPLLEPLPDTVTVRAYRRP